MSCQLISQFFMCFSCFLKSNTVLFGVGLFPVSSCYFKSFECVHYSAPMSSCSATNSSSVIVTSSSSFV